VNHEEDSREVLSEEQQAAAVAFQRKKRLVWNLVRVLLLILTAYLFAQYQFR
jgi:hypothetical protein